MDDDAYIGDKKKEQVVVKPKKPQTSYFHYMNQKRAGVKADEPELTHGELTKKLTIMWKALSDTERAIYEDLAAKDKARYRIEMEDSGLKKKLTDAEANVPIKYRKKFILWSTVERLKIKQTDDTIPNPAMLKMLAEIW